MKMGKEILTFDKIEIEKNKFYRQKTPFCGGYEYLKRFILVKKKTINTILVTCTIIIKLSPYKSRKRLLLRLLIINKYCTMNSIKPFAIKLLETAAF